MIASEWQRCPAWTGYSKKKESEIQLLINKYGQHTIDAAARLSQRENVAILINFIKRQAPLMEQFDVRYGENRSRYFLNMVELSLNVEACFQDEQVWGDMLATLDSEIPDSEEFGDIEGDLAQNALISASYAIQYMQYGKLADFCASAEKVLETVDVLHYSENPDYDERKAMMREIGLLGLLVRGLSVPLTNTVLENLDEIARNAPIGADSAEE
ncbi:hypothetical protein [Janthinobacterium sp. BJB426]|uniref:hypothetical protein n=1 Tax=Janthinobacterium sp. BJB426 TaxID=2048010 RepID=UPI0013050F93|nr:hypothetical protein [Janthinobacterium sp. BJB426]